MNGTFTIALQSSAPARAGELLTERLYAGLVCPLRPTPTLLARPGDYLA